MQSLCLSVIGTVIATAKKSVVSVMQFDVSGMTCGRCAASAEAATKAGYPAKQIARDEVIINENDEAKEVRRDVLIAGAMTLPIFSVEMGGHLVPVVHMWVMQTIGAQTSRMIQFVLEIC